MERLSSDWLNELNTSESFQNKTLSVTFLGTIPSMKEVVPFPNMPKITLSPFKAFKGMSVSLVLQNIKYLWKKVFRKVAHFCVTVNTLLNTKMFFMCVGETVTMMEESVQKALGFMAQEMSGEEAKNMDIRGATMESSTHVRVSKSEMLEVALNGVLEVVFLDVLHGECKEEEEEDYDGDDTEKSEDEEDGSEWDEDDNSDWSEDEGDWEGSTESNQLWESFVNNDHYNPLYSGLKTNTPDMTQCSTTRRSRASEPEKETSASVEKPSLEQSTKKVTKKVRFSEEVTEFYLEDWGSASREARDGSCWLEMARDRDRFRRRVETIGAIISPCLEAQNRASTYERLQRACQSKQF